MSTYEMIDRDEMIGYDEYRLDAESDFSQLMKEARKHRSEARRHRSEASSAGLTECLSEEKKGKKTWKKSLSSWWKSFKKSNKSSDSRLDLADAPRNSKIREGNVSGPMYQSAVKVGKPLRRSKSGPVTDLFAPNTGIETEMPYSALSKASPDDSRQKLYGPVYLVT